MTKNKNKTQTRVYSENTNTNQVNKLIAKSQEITKNFLPENNQIAPSKSSRREKNNGITNHLLSITNLAVGSSNYGAIEIELIQAGVRIREIIELNQMIENEECNKLIKLQQELITLWKPEAERAQIYQAELEIAHEKINELNIKLVNYEERESYINSLEKELENTQKKYTETIKKFSELNKENKKYHKELEDLQNENKSLQANIKKLDRHRESLIKKHIEEKENWEDKIWGYKTEINSQGEIITSLNQKIKNSSGAENSQKTIKTFKKNEDWNKIIEKLAEQETAIRDLEFQNDGLIKKVEEQEKEIKELREWKANYQNTPLATPIHSWQGSFYNSEDLKKELIKLHIDLPKSSSPDGYFSSPSLLSDDSGERGGGVWDFMPQNTENHCHLPHKKSSSGRNSESFRSSVSSKEEMTENGLLNHLQVIYRITKSFGGNDELKSLVHFEKMKKRLIKLEKSFMEAVQLVKDLNYELEQKEVELAKKSKELKVADALIKKMVKENAAKEEKLEERQELEIAAENYYQKFQIELEKKENQIQLITQNLDQQVIDFKKKYLQKVEDFNQLKKKISDLQKNYGVTITKTVQKVNQKLEQKISNVNELSRKNKGLVKEKKTLKKLNRQRSDIISIKDAEIEKLLVELKEKSFNEFEALSDKKRLIMENITHVSSLYDEQRELEDKVTNLEEGLAKEKESLEGKSRKNQELEIKIEELEFELAKIKANEEHLNTEYEKICDEADDLRLEKTDLEERLRTTTEKNNKLEEELQKLTENQEEAESQISELEAEKGQAKETEKSLNTKIFELESKLKDTESQKNLLHSELVENESRIAIQDSETDRLRAELTELEKVSEIYYKKSEKKIKELEKDLAAAQAALPEEVEMTAWKHKERITELTGIFCAKETNLTELEGKLGGAKLTALEVTLAEYLAQSKENKKQLDETKAETTKSKGEWDQEKKEVEELYRTEKASWEFENQALKDNLHIETTKRQKHIKLYTSANLKLFQKQQQVGKLKEEIQQAKENHDLELEHQRKTQLAIIQKLENQLTTLKKLAEKELMEHNQINTDLTKQNETYQAQIRNFKKQRDTFWTRYTKQKNHLNNQTETITDLKKQLTLEQKENKNLMEELTAADNSLGEKYSQLTQLISEKNTTQLEKEKKIQQLKKQFEIIQKKLVRSKRYQQEQINNSNTKIDKQQGVILEQKADLNLLITQRNKFGRDYLAAKKEIKKQEILITQLQTELKNKEKLTRKEIKTLWREVNYLKDEKEELAKLLIQAKNKHRQLVREKTQIDRTAQARSFLLSKYRTKLHAAETEISILKGEKLNLENKVDILRDAKSELYAKLKAIKQAQKKQAQKAQNQNVCQDLIVYRNISEDWENKTNKGLENALVKTTDNLIDTISTAQTYLGITDLTKLVANYKMPRGTTLKDLINFYNSPPQTIPHVQYFEVPKEVIREIEIERSQPQQKPVIKVIEVASQAQKNKIKELEQIIIQLEQKLKNQPTKTIYQQSKLKKWWCLLIILLAIKGAIIITLTIKNKSIKKLSKTKK
ncbi:MAG: hypothetical protein MRERC_1c082 [Mycoplasmataceae bacterium RC_NB112A]|nr:MAG: hypothetical protein MRERC_1c082 [Mycoplasmataceae bacterium RC_NB112A]